MKTQLYKIDTQSSMKAWSHREYKLFANEEEASDYVNNLKEERGHNYRATYLQDLTSQMIDSTPADSAFRNDAKHVQESTGVSDVEWEEDYNTDEFPRGWWRNKEFVAKDGTVFNQKEIQPDKYRTLPPSEY